MHDDALLPLASAAEGGRGSGKKNVGIDAVLVVKRDSTGTGPVAMDLPCDRSSRPREYVAWQALLASKNDLPGTSLFC